jgi:hypothetical protein
MEATKLAIEELPSWLRRDGVLNDTEIRHRKEAEAAEARREGGREAMRPVKVKDRWGYIIVTHPSGADSVLIRQGDGGDRILLDFHNVKALIAALKRAIGPKE